MTHDTLVTEPDGFSFRVTDADDPSVDVQASGRCAWTFLRPAGAIQQFCSGVCDPE